MWDFVKSLYGWLAVMPFLPFAAVYLIVWAVWRDKKRAVRVAMDTTTVLLIGAVAGLFKQLSGSGFGAYGLLLIALIAAGLIGNLQVRTKGRVDASRIVRAVWRLGFLFMSVLYVVFFVAALGRTLWTA